MPPCWLLTLAAVAVTAGSSVGQTVVTRAKPPLALPACGLPTDPGPTALPPGTTVSRPLQPVVDPATGPFVADPSGPDLSAEWVEELMPATPLGRSWQRYEYLLWWPKAAPVPPLVTAAPGAADPVLGGRHTAVLIGDEAIADPDVSGGRFTLGSALNDANTVGVEVTYVFLGSRTATARVSGPGVGPAQTLGRPLVDPTTRSEYTAAVAVPGVVSGGLTAETSFRLSGWEVSGVANLVSVPGMTVNATAGYRYLMVNEGLRIEQTAWTPTDGPGPFPPVVLTADQFDAHNRFHGGQLGLQADLGDGPVFLELTGKIGLGQTTQVVRTSGTGFVVAPGVGAFPLAGGVLGQPSNAGRFVNSAFAVLPEAGVKVGYRLPCRSKVFVGYNFLYLSDVVRPGDQVDREVDPGSVPAQLLGRPTGRLFADRPAARFERADFWAQGLVFGLEYRY